MPLDGRGLPRRQLGELGRAGYDFLAAWPRGRWRTTVSVAVVATVMALVIGYPLADARFGAPFSGCAVRRVARTCDRRAAADH